MRRNWSAIYIILFVVGVLFIGLLGRVPLQLRWLAIMGVFVALVVAISREVTGTPGGAADGSFLPGRMDAALIDDRNKVSLARLQSVLWTVVVLSAWGTFALHRVQPVAQGKLLASGSPILREVAELLAAPAQPSEDQTRSAAAMLEQITGAEVTIPEDLAATAADQAGYDPLAINIPQEVWLAMGISIASLTGAGIIKANKAADKSGKAHEVAQKQAANAGSRANVMEVKVAQLEAINQAKQTEKSTLESMMQPAATEAFGASAQPALTPAEQTIINTDLARVTAEQNRVENELRVAADARERARVREAELNGAIATAVGELHFNTTKAEARWSDMLRGDTVADFSFIDLGKVQMFFLTVILVFSYAALIWGLMAMPLAAQVLRLTPSMNLPAFSDSLIITMALSHTGYLATKATG